MVGLMGVFMIIAAYRKDWRKPILIYSLSGSDEHRPPLFARILGWRWDGRHGRPIHSRLLRSIRLHLLFHERTFKLRHCGLRAQQCCLLRW
jgi:hypothetical protein